MKLQTRIGDPSSEEGTKLLKDSYSLMSSLFPPEDNHALSIDDFNKPNIRFIIAEKNSVPCGCGALAIKSNYGELKSIYVDEISRGNGIGDLIMMGLETDKKFDFTECGPFGEYKESPHSFFMYKKIN